MAHWPRLFVPPCSFILDVRTSENEKEAWRMLIFHDATNTQVAYCLIMHDVTVIERINWSLTEGAGVVVCVKQGADLHMAQPMPLPLTLSSSAKSILVLPFWYDTIRYDTRCYFNVRSKADISQLNLPHGTDN